MMIRELECSSFENVTLTPMPKDKRRQIKSLKDRLRNRFNASVAEIDALDKWQQAVMGLNDKSYLEKQYSLVETLVLE